MKINYRTVIGPVFVFLLISFIVSFAVPALASDRLPFPEPPTRTDDPLWGRAVSHWENRRQDLQAQKALEIFQALSEKYPGRIEPRIWLCRAYYFLGMLESGGKKRNPLLRKSINFCQKALELDPQNVYALYWLVGAWYHIEPIDPILSQIRILTAKRPIEREIFFPADAQNWKEVMDRWDARADLNQARRAADLLEKIANKDSNSLEAWMWLARVYYWLGENGETQAERERLHYRGYEFGLRALKIAPGHARANYWAVCNLARYAQLGSIARRGMLAKKIIDHLRIIDQEEPIYFFGGVPRYIAYALAESGPVVRKLLEMLDFSDVLSPIKMSIAVAPNYFEIRLALAEYAAAIGDKDLAREQLDYIVGTSAELIPGYEPENRLYQERARKLLEILKR
jgi:tetratricopeptide (TPR) repeat protein